MPPFSAPHVVAGSVAVSRYDALELEGDDNASLHLEQVDTQRSLRQLGVFKEILCRIVCYYDTAARVTLCVRDTNHPARDAYKAVGFKFALQDGRGVSTYVLNGKQLEALRIRDGSCLAAAAPCGIHFYDTPLGGARALHQSDMYEACCGQSLPSEAGAFCLLVRSLCAANLREYQTEPLVEAAACEAKALQLLMAADGHATEDNVTYFVALIPRAELKRSVARLCLREVAAATQSTDTQLHAAFAAWELANTAADFEKAATARLLVEADQLQTLCATLCYFVYFVLFDGPRAQPRGYVGSKSNHSTRACEHVERKGAAWTARYSNRLQEKDFHFVELQSCDKQEALVAELVTLMQHVGVQQGREWRGGPFLTCDKARWDKDKKALWEALTRVKNWPTDVVGRLDVLAGIGHLVPGKLLWHYTNDLCFTCGCQGHYAKDCANIQLQKQQQNKRPRQDPPLGAGEATAAGSGCNEGEAEPTGEADDEASPQASARPSGTENEDAAPAPAAPPEPHVLWSRQDVPPSETSRAASQVCEQGFVPPDGLAAGNLSGGYAIASCPRGNGLRGKDFALRCVLARTHCINTGGGASDAILYDQKGRMRALLSPRGVRAFYAVVFAVQTDELAALRKASTTANANRLPVELIRSLRCGGLERSIDSGMPLPNVDACSPVVLDAWWKMHLAGVAALASTEKLAAWNATCLVFGAARQAPAGV